MTDFIDTLIDFRRGPRVTENIISVTRAATLDVWRDSRSSVQNHRDGSLRGLACEVLGEQRARRWMQACDAVDAHILNAYLLRRARSSQPVNFAEAAAAVWA